MIKITKLRIVITVFVFLVTGVLHARQRPAITDFSGNWKVNIGKSDFGQFPQTSAPTLMEIAQNKETISLKRTISDLVNTEILNFDSKPFVSSIPPRIESKTSYLKWSEDGKSITVFQHYKMKDEGQDPWEFDRTEKYYLSADGRTLFLERSSVYPDRTESIKAAYDKQ